MKTTTCFFVLVCAVCSLCISSHVFAQEEMKEDAHFYIVTTWKTVMPEGGSAVERDSLLMEWIEGVLRKNDKILSEKSLRHYYGSDLQDWVVITEYKIWADIKAASEMNEELAKKKWPDEKKREKYFKKLMRYFSTHSDEIYRELPKFRKGH